MIKTTFQKNEIGFANPNIYMSGNTSSINTFLIKKAALCKNYSSDIIYDISAMEKKIQEMKPFSAEMFIYDNGVHSTLESENVDIEVMKQCSQPLICHVFIEFKPDDESERFWTLSLDEV